MDRLVKAAGTIALGIIGLTIAVAALSAIDDIFFLLLNIIRYAILPGLLWVTGIVVGLWIVVGIVRELNRI